jgi:hypothetical protein
VERKVAASGGSVWETAASVWKPAASAEICNPTAGGNRE